MIIDVNCDMGEGSGNDGKIMPYISSANIACGCHAGNDDTMHATVRLTLLHGVAIGAHPGFNDPENFGRIEMHVSDAEIYQLIIVQLNALQSICAHQHTRLHHVKPHGALYNMAAKNTGMSRAIAQAVVDFDPSLLLYGLSGSLLLSEAGKIGLQTCAEVFADRTYQADGSLTPRSQANALITDLNVSVQQVLQMIKHGLVTPVSGVAIPVVAETICIHGDGSNAVTIAKTIWQQLQQNQIDIKPKQ